MAAAAWRDTWSPRPPTTPASLLLWPSADHGGNDRDHKAKEDSSTGAVGSVERRLSARVGRAEGSVPVAKCSEPSSEAFSRP